MGIDLYGPTCNIIGQKLGLTETEFFCLRILTTDLSVWERKKIIMVRCRSLSSCRELGGNIIIWCMLNRIELLVKTFNFTILIIYGRVGLFKFEELSQTVKELWHILDVQD